MKAIPFPQSNKVLKAPPGQEQEVYDLHVWGGEVQGIQRCISCWEPSPQERAAIAAGGPVWLWVMGTTHPPLVLDAASPFEPTVDIQGWPPGVSDGLALPCHDCGQTPLFDYVVADEFWGRWVGGAERLGVICLPCLDRRCRGEGLSDALQQVQWTGTGHTIVLAPVLWHKYASLGDATGEPSDPAAEVTVEDLFPAWQMDWPAGVALYMQALRRAGLPAPEFRYEEIPRPAPGEPDKDRVLLRLTLLASGATAAATTPSPDPRPTVAESFQELLARVTLTPEEEQAVSIARIGASHEVDTLIAIIDRVTGAPPAASIYRSDGEADER